MPSIEQTSGSPTKPPQRGSPRSSVDSGVGGHSPFLHSLHQRFRKNSSASAQSTEPAPPQLDVKSRSDASKEAKLYLLSVVKDSWEYPSIGAAWPDKREPVSYRRREDGLSDAESDATPHRRRSRNDPYKFENPDAVADFVAQRRAKRRRLLEEEMTWNSGLRVWSEQRDAWTGAVKHRPKSMEPVALLIEKEKPQLSSTLHQRNTSESTTDESINWPLSPHSPTPEHSSSIDSVDIQHSSTTQQPTSLAQLGSRPPHTDTFSPPPPPPQQDSTPSDNVYLPIYAPLFPPTHPLRSRITPSVYPTIYSKVVLQSLTPNIPIPLTHMTRALVEGWKAEGNFPPGSSINTAGQAGTLVDAKSVGGRLKPGKMESAFTRWRRERQGKNLGLPQRQRLSMSGDGGKSRSSVDGLSNSMDGVGIGESGGAAGKGRVRKSLTIVKRAFGVNDETSGGAERGKPGGERGVGAGVDADVSDIGIDFEEQERQEWEMEEQGMERDRVLNQALLGAEEKGEKRKSWSKG